MPRAVDRTRMAEEAVKRMSEREKDYVARMVLAVLRSIYYTQRGWD